MKDLMRNSIKESLHTRVSRLETLSGGGGPLFFSWRESGSRRASANWGGHTYTQSEDEHSADYFARVAQAVPCTAFLWVDRLEEA